MLFIPKMAFLNLARYKKRTMITAGAIAYGLLMLIIMRSLLTGIDSESITNLRLYETATGRIMVPGYWEGQGNLSPGEILRSRRGRTPPCGFRCRLLPEGELRRRFNLL